MPMTKVLRALLLFAAVAAVAVVVAIGGLVANTVLGTQPCIFPLDVLPTRAFAPAAARSAYGPEPVR